MLFIAPFFFAAALFSLSGCQSLHKSNSEPPPELEERPKAVRTVYPRKESIARTLDYVATVEAARQVQVLGRITATALEFHLDQGDPVRLDAPLLTMNSPELEAQQRRLAAEVEAKRREHQYLCRTHQTNQSLADQGVTTSASADASEMQCLVSREALNAAQAALAELQQRRSYLRETSPIDGLILERHIEPGEFVTPGRPLFTIGSQEMELRVQVSERDLTQGIEPGLPVGIKLSTSREQILARSTVTHVAPLLRTPGRTGEVRIGLPDELQSSLRIGMSVDVSFILQESPEAITLKADALSRSPEGPAVFVIENNRLHRTAVTLGIETDSRVEITSPLPLDSPVASGRLSGLQDLDLVYPVGPQEAR